MTLLILVGVLIIAALMWVCQPITNETDAVYYDPDEVSPARPPFVSDYQPWPGDMEFRDEPKSGIVWEFDEDAL
jgi:hypothetical protein